MNKFWIIASDVYKKNVKSISFLIMILIPFIAIGVIYLAGLFAGQAEDIKTIGVYSDEPQVAEAFAQSKTEDYQFKAFDSEEKAQSQLKSEKVDAYLVLAVEEDEVKGTLFSESSLGQSTEMIIQQTLSNLQSSARAQALGLSSEQVASLAQPAVFEKQKVSFDSDGKMETGEDNSFAQYIVSYVGTIVLFVFIITYAQIIAQEIASEKGTRIMEVILSSTKAQTHFYGKLTGVLLVAITQIALYGLIGGISYSRIKNMAIVKQYLDNFSLGDLFGPFLFFTILFVLLGILIYAVLAALCGSLVNKAEDTAKAILPVTYLSLAGYMLGLILGAADPNNIVIRVSSYIPFLSSYTMPIRLANDTVTTGGAVISVLILAATTLVMMLASARMYKSNVLIYNENGVWSALKQSFSLMKNER
ncbi:MULTISPECIES: ABC transporter permease [Enterococcus]|uniref:ABC transporter permease n=1 Tax=Enterococcus TaxID=1350 RepID=UPI00065E07A2|nr:MULTISPECIES: ABC transporter permease [Enterococcus]KAF1303451.1 sodium ABC transporter permease [Enterococcus sp. JM9B]